MNAAQRSAPFPRTSMLRDLLATHDSSSPDWAQATPLSAAGTGPRSSGQVRWRIDPPPSTEQRSLFGEILDWMLAPLLLLWPLSVAITFVVARSLADAPFDRALVDHAAVLEQQAHAYLAGGPLPDARQLQDLLPADAEGKVLFQIIASDGEMLRGEADLPPPSLYDFPEAGVVKLRNDSFQGNEVRIAYTHVQGEDSIAASPALLVQVAETQEKRDRLANEIIKGVIFPQFVILPLAVALVWFGLGRGLAPLNRVRERLHERPLDDLSPIDRAGVPSEISPLVDGFNELLERLDERVAAQKRFIADAAHQMKTPLAGLRTQAELALRESDPTQLRQSLRQIARSSERAAHMISQLLSLARMENQRDIDDLQAMDLVPFTQEIVGEWAGAATARRIDFGFEHDGLACPIEGHPIWLRELLGNLIDNALRYTPVGGRVTVRLRHEALDPVLEVEDSGPGLAPTDRALVFERFYRVLGSGTEGSGLGLAIVREIAQQHRATVEIHGHDPSLANEDLAPDAVQYLDGDNPRIGAVFRVRFPAAFDNHHPA